MMEDPLVNRLHDDDLAISSSSAGIANNMTVGSGVGGSTPLGFDIPLVTTDYCPFNGTNENCTGAVAAGGDGVNNATAENSINMFYFYEVT